jgi:hypothetical protein
VSFWADAEQDRLHYVLQVFAVQRRCRQFLRLLNTPAGKTTVEIPPSAISGLSRLSGVSMSFFSDLCVALSRDLYDDNAAAAAGFGTTLSPYRGKKCP